VCKSSFIVDTPKEPFSDHLHTILTT